MHINSYVLGTWKGVNLLLFMTASSNNVVYFHMYLWNRVRLSHKWWCINLQKCLKSVREKKEKENKSSPFFVFIFGTFLRYFALCCHCCTCYLSIHIHPVFVLLWGCHGESMWLWFDSCCVCADGCLSSSLSFLSAHVRFSVAHIGSKQLSGEIQKSIMLTKDPHDCSSVDAARPWLSLRLGFIQEIKASRPSYIPFLWKFHSRH